MKLGLTILLLMVLTGGAYSQDKLFQTDANLPKPRYGFIITGNADFDMPAGDMAKSFGLDYRVGFGTLYKSKKNWVFGAKCDFILGNDVKNDSLMINIRDQYNTSWNGKYVEFINSGGTRVAVPIYERGYSIGLEAGRIFKTSKYHPDNGIMVLTSGGFMQYKIDIYNSNKDVYQIRGNYLKGYDRLTNGIFFEQYVGYVYFSKNRLINFHLGLDALFGITQDRRDYLYDVMHTDNKQRLDILYGLRGGWYIPMFRRKSEDLLFD